MTVATPVQRIVLAQESEFALGGLRVYPPKREVMAGDFRELIQPRIMQVLVVLARRRGEVVTRDELIAACWGGFAVSDDAIHRCIARIRRLSEAHGGFCVETVPRVGYQLTETVAPAHPRLVFWKDLRALLSPVMLLIAGALLLVAGMFGVHLF